MRATHKVRTQFLQQPHILFQLPRLRLATGMIMKIRHRVSPNPCSHHVQFSHGNGIPIDFHSSPLIRSETHLAAADKGWKMKKKVGFSELPESWNPNFSTKKACLPFSKSLHREVDPSMWMALMAIHSQQQHRASIQQHLTVASRHRPQAEAHGSGIHLAGVSSYWVSQWNIPRNCIYDVFF